MYNSQDYSIMNTFINYRIEESLELPINNCSSSGDGSQPDSDQERFFLDMDSINKKDNNIRKGFDNNRKKKCISLDDDLDDIDDNSWINKAIKDWSQGDTINWLMYAASHMGQLYSSIQNNFALPGKDLLLLTKQDFISFDPIYGDKIYDLLHSQHKGFSIYQNFPSVSEDEEKAFSSSNFSDAESENSMEIPNQRHPGRPKSQKPKKHPPSQGKLWEFIRDLLKNRETCPSLICWENYTDAKFRFVRSDEVAKLWGSRKGNTKMTYEKLSRAMRYYYKSKIFLPVLGRRLVYQFGPNAKGWQTDNPNFRR